MAGQRTRSVTRRASIVATPEQIWSVLADFGALADWVPPIAHSCLLSDQTEGPGTVRRVQIARQTLVERVTRWEPPSTLAYSIEGLPPMVGAVSNTWTVRASGRTSQVSLTTEIVTGLNPVRTVIADRVLGRMGAASEFMLAGLAGRVATPVEERS